MRSKYFFHCLILLALLAIAAFSMTVALNASEAKLGNTPKDSKTQEDPFEKITLEAKGALVLDVVNNRVLFSKNADMPLPLASLTKVMTAVTAEEETAYNQKSKEVQIKPEHLIPEGDSSLIVGDTWNAKDLRDFTLVTSSNDGAAAVAATSNPNHTLFIKAMNALAKKIGLEHSAFFNEHGLDQQDHLGGAYGSARDMASLFSYTLQNHPEVLEATRYKQLTFASSEKTYSATNTNTIIDNIPNLIASKTGYTDLAGGNLVIAYDAGVNQPIIISVLGSTKEGRFTDTLKLIEASREFIKSGR